MTPFTFEFTPALAKLALVKLTVLAFVMTQLAQCVLIVDGSFDRDEFDDASMSPYFERAYAVLPYSSALRRARTVGLNAYQPIGESYFPRRTKSKREIDAETRRGQLASPGRDMVGKRLFVARIGKRQINIARVGK